MPRDVTIDRLLALRRLLSDMDRNRLELQRMIALEENRLRREVWASHESGTSAPDIARAHRIPVNQVRRIIQEWRREHNIRIRQGRRRR